MPDSPEYHDRMRFIREFLDFAAEQSYSFGYWDSRLGNSFFEYPDDDQLNDLIKMFVEK